MDLDSVWEKYLKLLQRHTDIQSVHYKKVAGIPFLYIAVTNPAISMETILKHMKKCSALVMKGKQLHCETIYFRQQDLLFVFRHRFYVPQRKMFCCGNLCPDCIRFKDES
ncbi:hypothetical protein [Peribacillus alkalitolerans]|uniref:hypothetical protein n=1 Tax=Peribacillus alkalitolerans TaxID=1550385 RepID=UPI0013D02452|nr:hypothetical protein [Peribacillus alkalitolerans]